MTRLFLIGCFLVRVYPDQAQIDTISIKKDNLETSYVKEGTNQFFSCIKDLATGAMSRPLFWERQVSFDHWQGRSVVIVSQRRLYGDSAINTYVYTVSDRRTFQTIYDRRMSLKSGIVAYTYTDQDIHGDDTVAHNTKKDFHVAFTDLPYCFELDVETLSMLPLKKVGQRLAVNFYHPGGTVPPLYYPVEVVREEKLPSVNGTTVDCWVIRLMYDAADFDYSWISKKEHEFLKLEAHFPKGMYYKVKLCSPLGEL